MLKADSDSTLKRKPLTFNDETLPTVSCKEIISKEVQSENVGVQTKFEIKVTDSSCQSVKRKDREIQTDIDQNTGNDEIRVDYGRLNKFLERTKLLMFKYLEDNRRQRRLFRQIKFKNQGNDLAEPLFTLTYPEILTDKEIHVTSLSWSTNGSTIAVGYGSSKHEALCIHKGAVCTWNIERYKINPQKPDFFVETSACVTSLACHPEHPAIIAAGLYNGEILVWDFRKADDPLIANVGERQDLHRDSVSSLNWIREPKVSKKKFILVSTSQDGKILLWNPLPSKNTLKLLDAYFVSISSLAKTSSKLSGKPMGVTCITFNTEDPETFVFGCDSGQLYKGSLNSNSLAHSREEGLSEMSVQAKNPITITFEHHDGPIYSVDFSPFHRNTFLSCGLDDQIRIYSQLLPQSGLCISPSEGYLYSAQWSPSRPMILVVGTEHAGALMYDLEPQSSLSISSLIPIQTLQSSDKKSAIYAVKYNVKRPNILACGDGAGAVTIWELAEKFVIASDDEKEALQSLAKSFGEN